LKKEKGAGQKFKRKIVRRKKRLETFLLSPIKDRENPRRQRRGTTIMIPCCVALSEKHDNDMIHNFMACVTAGKL
jgi:hypothetical protein